MRVLILVATPIGNLTDISLRAIDTLKMVDLILCEDTRRSKILLNHFGIERKPLKAFHQFSEKKLENSILTDLLKGMKIALISDAGTPLISDPGLSLVQAAISKNIPVTTVPGPCSPIQALLMSGFATDTFQYIGFLPRTDTELNNILYKALYYHGTTIAMESSQRLIKTLGCLNSIAPKRLLAIARELTKTYEECIRGDAATLLRHYDMHPPKGEVILVIDQGPPPIAPNLDVEELVKLLQEHFALTLKEALLQASKILNMPKRAVYEIIHRTSDE